MSQTLIHLSVAGVGTPPDVPSPKRPSPRRCPLPPGTLVWDRIELVAKRIEHVPHSNPRPRVALKSANPRIRQPRAPVGEVSVVGRAVWVS